MALMSLASSSCRLPGHADFSLRHNQGLFNQATGGRPADGGPVSFQQLQQRCDFANGQKMRKQTGIQREFA
jgi:hypothetical protein